MNFCISNDDSECEHLDFESALKSEIKDIKTKKNNVLAIRNDVKGIVFFKTSSGLDVNAIFQELVKMIKARTWKPK